jgi:hypothetical protein
VDRSLLSEFQAPLRDNPSEHKGFEYILRVLLQHRLLQLYQSFPVVWVSCHFLVLGDFVKAVGNGTGNQPVEWLCSQPAARLSFGEADGVHALIEGLCAAVSRDTGVDTKGQTKVVSANENHLKKRPLFQLALSEGLAEVLQVNEF